MAAKTKIRMTLDLTITQNERLEALMDKSGASAKADVLRQALRLYDFALDKHTDGYEFLLRKDGETMLLPLFEMA